MKPSELLNAKLRERMASGLPVGFSPWRDADGMLWGRLLSVDEGSITVLKISPAGQAEEEETYPFSRISYFDTSEAYARRLQLLESFKPTLPEVGKWVCAASYRNKALFEGATSGSVIQMRLRTEPLQLSVAVCELAGDWADIAVLDDMCRDQNRYWCRRSMILAVREPDADADSEAETCIRKQK